VYETFAERDRLRDGVERVFGFDAGCARSNGDDCVDRHERPGCDNATGRHFTGEPDGCFGCGGGCAGSHSDGRSRAAGIADG
jgi:hypothetical protein